MIEVIYASALGVVIPVLFFSVASTAYLHASGRKRNTGEKLLSKGLILKLVVLIGACWCFRSVVSGIKAEPDFFDPYEVLQLPVGADKATIRANYKRLSLQYHPDKNRGDRKASRKFQTVNKAYRALSDPAGRRNYELYGNPDGPTNWTYDVPLPKWLKPGRNAKGGTLYAYALGYIGVLISALYAVKLAVSGIGPGPVALAVSEEDAKMLVASLGENTDVPHLLECVANVPQLRTEERREAVLSGEGSAQLAAAIKQLRDKLVAADAVPLAVPAPAEPAGGKRKNKAITAEAHVTSSEALTGFFVPNRNALVEHNLVLLLAALHEKRGCFIPEGWVPPDSLVKDQAFILQFSELLMDVCVQVAAQKGSLPLLCAVIECKAVLRRRLWSATDPNAKLLQAANLEPQGVAVPQVTIPAVKVETWGEDQIAVGDTVTAHVTIQRAHAGLYRGFKGLKPIEGTPVFKGEPWWFLLARVGPAGQRVLMGATPTLVDDLGKEQVTAEVKFKAPGVPGKVDYIVLVRSPVFIGVDVEQAGSFDVVGFDQIRDDDDDDDDGDYNDDENED